MSTIFKAILALLTHFASPMPHTHTLHTHTYTHTIHTHTHTLYTHYTYCIYCVYIYIDILCIVSEVEIRRMTAEQQHPAEAETAVNVSAVDDRDEFLKTDDFNCYSGLCRHKNWFADLNRCVSVVSRYKIRLTLNQLRITRFAQTDLCWSTRPQVSLFPEHTNLSRHTVNPEKVS